MLILLKPWTHFDNLKPMSISWLEVYDNFTASCEPQILQLINNMQILHKCKDSWDDHFAKHNVECRAEARRAEQSDNCACGLPADADGLDETDVLAHLKGMVRQD